VERVYYELLRSREKQKYAASQWRKGGLSSIALTSNNLGGNLVKGGHYYHPFLNTRSKRKAGLGESIR